MKRAGELASSRMRAPLRRAALACLPLASALAWQPPAGAEQALAHRVVARYPHDRNAFTQGLLYYRGKLYESTGRYGHSELREVELETGRVLRKRRLPATDFGEGLARVAGQLVQLTWPSGHGYRWQLDSFALLGRMPYRFAAGGKAARGWGLCFDGAQLVLSDGSAKLYFLDPRQYRVARQVEVRDASGPVARLNELECVGGQVYANVWPTDTLLVIDAASGRVAARADLGALHPPARRRGDGEVMNGIAWDGAGGRLFVTGKHWPRLFHIELRPAPEG